MSEMKLIMEGWRGYLVEDIVGKPLFEDYEYITGVLGVRLPLNEGGDVVPLTEELKQKILQEQILFEAFWDGLVATVKTKAGEAAGRFVDAVEGVKTFGKEGWNILQKFYSVATNPDLMSSFITIIWRTGVRPLYRQIRQVLTQLTQYLSSWGMPTLGDAAAKVLEIFNKTIETVRAAAGWKKVIASAGLAIGLLWLWDKVKDFVEPYLEWMEKIKDVINDPASKLMEEFKTWIQSAVQSKLLNILKDQFGNVIDQLISVTSGIKPWWDAAVKAVGTAQLVINALAPAMGSFQKHQDFEAGFKNVTRATT